MLRDKFIKFLEKNGVRCTSFDDVQLLELIAQSVGLELFKNEHHELQTIKGLFQQSEFSAVKASKWEELGALPIKATNSNALVFVTDPFKPELQKELSLLLRGRKVELLLGNEADFKNLLACLTRDISSADLHLQLEEEGKEVTTLLPQQNQVDTLNESQIKPEDIAAPLVIRVLDNIFADSLDKGASDIHLVPTTNGLEVKVRVDGMLKELFLVPQKLKHPVVSRLKLLCGMDIAEKRKPQDGRLRLKTEHHPVDLRIATVPSVHGETVVIRVLSNKSTNITLESLGLPDSTLERLRRNLRGSSKVILASGPTGSGKSSTLYACLSYLADGTRNIITIEDPVEYRIDGITQVQVNTKVDVSFAKGLRSALRQDPDVIMVGEIRDTETAQISMQASQTGHLVLSTIHTNTAEGAVTRLLDLGIPSFLISSAISTVIAQRLVRRLQPDGSLAGRIGVFSILEIDDRVADAIRSGASEREIASLARANGFETLWENGESLVRAGLTTTEELERVLGPKPIGNLEVSTSSLQTRKTILLVEDDDSTRTVLSMLFQEQFFDVVEASNGFEALEKVHQAMPAIIVSDLMMPRMSGLDMVKKLRNDKRIANIPVLMLTAANSEENELRLLEHGADDFVSKTSDSKILLARVDRLLARQ